MTATEIAGFAGAGLAGAAYVPQISHLVRAHCSAGISRLAFAAWLLASVLTTECAVAIGAAVFVVLGGIQIVATTLIMLYAARYKDTPCLSHPPAPRAKTDTAGRETDVQAFGGRPRPRPAVRGLAPTSPDRQEPPVHRISVDRPEGERHDCISQRCDRCASRAGRRHPW